LIGAIQTGEEFPGLAFRHFGPGRAQEDEVIRRCVGLRSVVGVSIDAIIPGTFVAATIIHEPQQTELGELPRRKGPGPRPVVGPGDVSNRPNNIRGVKEFTYYPGMVRIPEGGAPDLKNRSFGISAVVEVPEGGAEGLIMTQGGRFAGMGLYLRDGKPVFHYNNCGVERYEVASQDKLTPGKHVVTLDFNYDGGGVGKGGTATLTVDGKTVASGKLPRTIPFRMSLDETLDIGEDTGTPVSEDYQLPFKFTGKLGKVTINIADHKLTEAELQQYREGRLKAALAQ
jgi:arylsulfatase